MKLQTGIASPISESNMLTLSTNLAIAREWQVGGEFDTLNDMQGPFNSLQSIQGWNAEETARLTSRMATAAYK